MTRKHYVMLAAALRDSLLKHYTDGAQAHAAAYQHAKCACTVANALAQDNPRFDRERFLKAAGVTAP